MLIPDIDGVNQICESTDQKNSLQCVNHNLHVAQSNHEYASGTPEFEHSVPRSNTHRKVQTNITELKNEFIPLILLEAFTFSGVDTKPLYAEVERHTKLQTAIFQLTFTLQWCKI